MNCSNDHISQFDSILVFLCRWKYDLQVVESIDLDSRFANGLEWLEHLAIFHICMKKSSILNILQKITDFRLILIFLCQFFAGQLNNSWFWHRHETGTWWRSYKWSRDYCIDFQWHFSKSSLFQCFKNLLWKLCVWEIQLKTILFSTDIAIDHPINALESWFHQSIGFYICATHARIWSQSAKRFFK